MKSNKSFFSVAVMLLLSVAIVSVGFTKAEVFDSGTAAKLAANYVPYGSTLENSESDKEQYHITFTKKDGAQNLSYNVAIDKAHQAVRSVKTTYHNNPYSRNVILGKSDIRQLIQRNTPDAVIHTLSLESVNGLSYYKVVYDTSTTSCELKLNTETGNTIEKISTYAGIAPYKR